MAKPIFDIADYDVKDPDPWLALFLDQSLPIDDGAKEALLIGNRSLTRQIFLPVARPFVFLFFLCVQLYRIPFSRFPNAPKLLHNLIHWGLKTFATPEANLLIMRHFNIGTEILNFIKDNVPDVPVETMPLRPVKLADLKDNTFIQHDLNVYNFLIELNAGLREQGRALVAPKTVNFDAISGEVFEFEAFPKSWHNFADVQTAIEFYTPIYCLLLSRSDFVRASNSLQLDETIGIYLAQILGSNFHMSMINNHHPMVPLSTYQAGFRLMMHGYDAEALHGYLRLLKKKQAAGEPLPGS